MSSHFCDLPKSHPELGAIWCHQLSDGRREGPKALPHLYVAALDLGECPQPGHIRIRFLCLSTYDPPCHLHAAACVFNSQQTLHACVKPGVHSLSFATHASQTGFMCSRCLCHHHLRVCSSRAGVAHRSGSHAGNADLSGRLPDMAVCEGGCRAAPDHTAELSEDDCCLFD